MWFATNLPQLVFILIKHFSTYFYTSACEWNLNKWNVSWISVFHLHFCYIYGSGLFLFCPKMPFFIYKCVLTDSEVSFNSFVAMCGLIMHICLASELSIKAKEHSPERNWGSENVRIMIEWYDITTGGQEPEPVHLVRNYCDITVRTFCSGPRRKCDHQCRFPWTSESSALQVQQMKTSAQLVRAATW